MLVCHKSIIELTSSSHGMAKGLKINHPAKSKAKKRIARCILYDAISEVTLTIQAQFATDAYISARHNDRAQ